MMLWSTITIILEEEEKDIHPFIREHDNSHVAHAHGSKVCIYHEQKTSALLTITVSSVVRIHFYTSRWKPHPHDGTITTTLDKNRLVEIPPRSGEPPDNELTKALWMQSSPAKNATCICMCTVHAQGQVWTLTFLLPQNGVVLDITFSHHISLILHDINFVIKDKINMMRK